MKFAIDLLIKVKEVGVFVQWMPLLEQIFSDSPQACVWLVDYLIKHKLAEVILGHTNGEVRE